jgi:iron complex outermembrane receptor protein
MIHQRHSPKRGAFLGAFALSIVSADVPAEPIERIEVTGTNIRRIAGESGLPIQIITREDLEKGGVMTASDVLDRISAHQSVSSWNDAKGIGDSNGAYTSASLRGLGQDRTLILFNGRRLAPYALSRGAAIDLSAIPLLAIERVEVLKDGASAIYGTDAIGGVINFILRKDFSGIEINATGLSTQQGGGETWRVNGTAGYGDLAKQRFNLFLNVDHVRQRALAAVDREFSRTGYLPELFIDGTSSYSTPANITQRDRNDQDADLGSPGACARPLTFRTPAAPLQCRFDAARLADILPPSEKTTVLGRVTALLTPNLSLFSEGSLYHGAFQYRVTPAPVFDVMLPSSRFYPAAYVTAQGGDPNLPIDVLYRLLPFGPRVAEGITDQGRIVTGLQGSAGKWEYEGALSYTANREISRLAGGFVSVAGYHSLFQGGLIDPFGNHVEQVSQALRSIALTGKIAESKASQTGFDLKASGDFVSLPAGPLGVAVGLEGRREKLDLVNDPALESGDIVGLSSEPGVSGVTRRVGSAFVEANAPLAKGFEVNVAVRTDRYSDFGTTTNPKVTLRWEATSNMLLRASAGTGFRAPSLFDLFEPVKIIQRDGFEDFLRCPTTGAPSDCAGSIHIRTGGNSTLGPERSKQANVGLVLENAGSSASVDYYRVKLRDRIGDPAPTPDRIVRGPPDPHFPELPGPILLFDLAKTNGGLLETSGVDLDVRSRTEPAPYGRVGLSLTGTYVLTYKADDASEFPTGPGRATGSGGAVPRWRHYAALDWSSGPFGATLAQTFQNGYTEPVIAFCRPTCTVFRRVGSYSKVDLQMRYSGFPRTRLTAGVFNLADRNPPLSGQLGSFQAGFDPRYADPRGRTYYLSVGYSIH